jgi:hypothetical protein
LLARNWFSMRERSREALTIASVDHVWLSVIMSTPIQFVLRSAK